MQATGLCKGKVFTIYGDSGVFLYANECGQSTVDCVWFINVRLVQLCIRARHKRVFVS